MITSYQSWLQVHLCMTKMISWRWWYIFNPSIKEVASVNKKEISLSGNNTKGTCDWKNNSISSRAKGQHISDRYRKRWEGQRQRERKENQDRHKEVWALEVIKGWTPVEEALKKLSRSSCWFLKLEYKQMLPTSPWKLGLLCCLEREILRLFKYLPLNT